MKTSSGFSTSASRVSVIRQLNRLFTVLGVAALILSTSTALLAQAPADQGRKRSNGNPGDRGGDRGNFNPQEMQARMLQALRDRLEITDDEEWKVISERIAKLNDLRRSAASGGAFGMFGGRGGPPGGGGDRGGPPGGGGDRGGQRPGGGSPELTALSSAVRDKLPDAEIKSRLERLREVRKSNEAKLNKAQEELRAVLSVRQEAVAVVFGLLP